MVRILPAPAERAVRTTPELYRLLAAAEKELAELDGRRTEILQRIEQLKQERDLPGPGRMSESGGEHNAAKITNESGAGVRIALFRSLFRGREDVYARRFEELEYRESRVPSGLSKRMDKTALQKTKDQERRVPKSPIPSGY